MQPLVAATSDGRHIDERKWKTRARVHTFLSVLFSLAAALVDVPNLIKTIRAAACSWRRERAVCVRWRVTSAAQLTCARVRSFAQVAAASPPPPRHRRCVAPQYASATMKAVAAVADDDA